MARIYKTDIIELKKAMIDVGLDKLVNLSEVSGIDRNTLSKIINEEVQPSSSVMDKLVVTLKLTPEKAGQIFFNPLLRNK
ncbi:helix-turn-helix transcriptional regulator [Clostridium sp. AM58-1XD]|uniref:helix-turn-helix domain-containing protein n=1 Tax=Clostridium sp. AM58-1XD TaxID=2292307 RepID=UPI000E532E41|nr:helix-turn-helix transcriptional regulator [Clostridium sp. AM58-1XD]RGZ00187.1 XRE family transcriptional regulator [Clostridium sp. AM58-1XD]